MKKFLIKSLIFVVYFACLLGLAIVLKWPQEFDSHVYLDNDFKLTSYLLLIFYRILVYFTLPFVMALVEVFAKKKKYIILLIDNFNVQFCTYALITGIYLIAGLDKLLGVEIFGSSDAMLFITGFVFTLILQRSIPSVISDK